ncbi:MAG: ABC transporter substrate-binding protein, partial [Nitrosopumilus sp.]|nr:ABC transporter substrate-binding protein [Nitrosopumilus sp.]
MKSKQLLSIVLSLIMVFGVPVGSAFAEMDDDNSNEENFDDDRNENNDDETRDDDDDRDKHDDLEDRLEDFCKMTDNE